MTDKENTFAFSADISQLLSLIINTMYSNKDIFLRELISNSSDAIDKIRYNSLVDSTQLDSEKQLRIDIIPDKISNTLTIRDTGIGMTKDDLVNNLGTIAKSGTKSFMEAVKAGADISMIGQFGIGFYSAYLVADNVEVYSKNNNDEQYCWTSNAGGSFNVKIDETTERLTRGTRIVLHLKEDAKDYLEENTLRNLIKKHSEFINFPINLWVEKTREEEIEDTPVVEDVNQDTPVVEDVNQDTPIVEDKQKRTVTYNEFDQVNTQRPIWLRKKDDITHEEYSAFYKSIANDWDDYLHLEHFFAEGQIEFKSILFIPKHAPFDMFNNENKNSSIKLYVRRVFIMDDCSELIPKYLSFIKGIVDSEDLPLNISREILQQNKILKVIKKNLTKKAIQMLTDLSEDAEKFKTFYKEFGNNIKLGVYEDSTNSQKLAKLLRFYSTKSGEEMTSFDEYMKRMKENQNNIYFITGESKQIVENSPFIEKLKIKGIEVLFMTDPIDEYLVQNLKEFESKKLVSLTKDGFKFEDENDDDKKEFEKAKSNVENLCKFMKDVLQDRVAKVESSSRLSNTPCCIVSSEYGISANMERIIKAQALRNNSFMQPSSKVMEINPYHPVIKNLCEKIKDENEGNATKNLVYLLYDTALLSSGYTHDDPVSFSNRIVRLISLGLDIEDHTKNVSEDLPPVQELVDEDDKMEQVD